VAVLSLSDRTHAVTSTSRTTVRRVQIIGYCRVSTADRLSTGYGLKAQEVTIRSAVSSRGWDLLEIVRDENYSGKSLNRPGLTHSLELIRGHEADGLAVAKLDRLSRSMVDFGRLVEWFRLAEATLLALDFDIDTSTPSGRLVANVLMSVAEWERDTIAARTVEGLAVARSEGRRIGPPAVTDQPALVEQIRALREDGSSLRAIAAELNRRGVATVRGGKEWRVSSVQTVLGYKRPAQQRQTPELPALQPE